MHRRMTQGLIVLAIVMMSVTASAQMGKESKGRSGMMGEGMMGGMMSGGMGMGVHGPGMEMGGMGEMMKMMGAAAKLDLTAEQKKKLQLSVLQHQKEAIPLLGQVRMAGVEIQELLLADHVNVDKVKAKVKEKYDAAAKLEISHLMLTQEAKKMLTPEQRQQMDSMMMQMGPMMVTMPMMESMMGSSPGEAKGEQAPKEAPTGPAEGAPESKDPHGH
ncbi:MAG: periplasmic heavy metal sensor [Nitrospirota bacterium]